MCFSFFNSFLSSGSVVFWVNPLILISLLKVGSNIIGNLDEVLVLSVVGWISVQVLFGDWEGLELLNGVVVMSNLWESEWLLVSINGMDVQLNFFSFGFQLSSALESLVEVLFVEGNWELFNFITEFSLLFFEFCLGSSLLLWCLLLLSKLDLMFLLLFGILLLLDLLCCLLLLSGFSSGLCFGFSLELGFSSCFSLGSSLSFGGNLLLSFSSDDSFLLSKHLLLSLLIFVLLSDEFLLLKSDLFQIHSLFGFHLLLDLEHLQLSFSLSSWELVLSLQSGKVCLSSGLLGSSSLGLLDSLSWKEFLFHLLSFEFLGGFFLLKFLELLGSLLW